MLAILVFVGLLYMGVSMLADMVVQLSQYQPQFYEPKDFSREELQQKQ